MFTIHPHPHHVWHPRLNRWLSAEDAATFALLGLPVGDRVGTAGKFPHTCKCEVKCHEESEHPEESHPHHVEVDCSTGMVGYTRL